MVELPRISIITTSYNSQTFLEETIRSVRDQNYPNLEYLILDGGSTDGSVQIIERYQAYLSYWTSERDRGQAHALNKGIQRTTGEIVAWLNSDDLYEPGAFHTVAQIYHENPGHLIAGNVIDFSQKGDARIIQQRNLTVEAFTQIWRSACCWHQPGLFFPGDSLRRLGGLNEKLNYTMDHDLMIRLLQVSPVVYVDTVLARFRRHPSSKTTARPDLLTLELSNLAQSYLPPTRGNRLSLRFFLLTTGLALARQGHFPAAVNLLRHSLR